MAVFANSSCTLQAHAVYHYLKADFLGLQSALQRAFGYE